MVHAVSKIPLESLFASEFYDRSICKMVREDEDTSDSSTPTSTPKESRNDVTASLQRVPSRATERGVDPELQNKLDSLLGI